MKNFFQLDLKKILLPVIDDQTNVLIHGHFPRNWTIFHKEGLYVDSCGLNINTYGWFLLLYDRKPQNSVKQFSFNSNVKKKKRRRRRRLHSSSEGPLGLWYRFWFHCLHRSSVGRPTVGLCPGFCDSLKTAETVLYDWAGLYLSIHLSMGIGLFPCLGHCE